MAKKAFASQEEQEAFKTFLQEKMEDAKAHPENYKLENEEDEAERERSSRVWEEGYVVRNKNTEGLGKNRPDGPYLSSVGWRGGEFRDRGTGCT